ncbi:MAG: GGDEF domain-containing protein [Pseudomonadota bacterium]
MAEHTTVKFNPSSSAKKGGERVPCLVMMEGTYVGEIYRIEKGSVTIGRADDADIVISDEGISRKHFRIDRHENSFTVTDLGSTNGTYVNGAPIKQSTLRDGDKITAGDVILSFSYQDSIDVNYREGLRNMAIRDGLTGLYNRRYLLDTLKREVSYAVRLRQPLTAVMFDIDHFKKINDNHGHAAGDLVLKTLGKALSEGLRAYDVFARYGGEEFVVLLRATALDNALIFAERLRKRTEDLSIEHEGKKIAVTISIGAAALDPDQAQHPEALVKEADRYLYEAKRRGRNRVCSPRG